MANKSRSYEELWKKLKKEKRVSIVAPIPVHKTIISMVRKEKNMDAEYKFLLAEENKSSKVKQVIVGSKITFTLEETITVYGI